MKINKSNLCTLQKKSKCNDKCAESVLEKSKIKKVQAILPK